MDNGSEERHEKLLSLANKLHEFLEWHPDQAVHVEPVLEHIGMELKAHSPLSGKCQALLYNEAGERLPPPCRDFRGTLSYSMCRAWEKIEKGEATGMSDAMRTSRTETFTQCRTEAPT